MASFAWTERFEACGEALPVLPDTDVGPRRKFVHQFSRESVLARPDRNVDDTSVLTELSQEAYQMRRRAAQRCTDKRLVPATYKRCPRKNLQNAEKAKTMGNGKASTHMPDIYIFAPCTPPGNEDSSVITIEALPPISFRKCFSGI
jgi:hypothetical protein